VTDSPRPPRRLTPNVSNINTAKWIAATTDPVRLVSEEQKVETKLGVDEEYDRLVLAFNEVADIAHDAKQRARLVLSQYGLSDHGFDVAFSTGYVPHQDKHASDDTPT